MPDRLTAEEQALLRAAVEHAGILAVAARLGVHREPLVRALAGLGTRRGTIALIRAGLAAPRPAEAAQ